MNLRHKIILYITAAISILVIIASVFLGLTTKSGGGYTGHFTPSKKPLPQAVYKDDILKYDDILKKDESNIEAYIRIAEAYYKLGDLDAAIDYLEKGYQATGSNTLYLMLCDYMDERDELESSSAVINNDLFAILAEYTYKDYVSKGASKIESGSDEVTLEAENIKAEVTFRNTSSYPDAVTDGEVIETVYPMEIVLYDPMDLFGGGYRVTFEKLQEFSLDDLKVSSEDDYPYAVTFKYKGCNVVIESNADGTIVSGASNYIVPDQALRQTPKQDDTHIDETFTVSGTVRSTQDEAVSGAHVQFSRSGSVQAEVTTGSSGGYSVTLPKGNYSVSVSVSGYESLYQSVSVTQDTTLNLTLTPNATPEPTEDPQQNCIVSGVVTNSDTGSPIAGAMLEFNDNDSLVTRGTVRTDGSGGYSISLPKASYTVSITCDNYDSSVQIINVTGNKTLNIQLSPTGPPPVTQHTINGYVMDANSLGGISGVDITFNGDNGSYTCRTGSDGYYEIRVNDGYYTVVMTHGNYEQQSESLSVEFDITMNFLMTPKSTPSPSPPDPTPTPTPDAQYRISGTVTDAISGAPLAGATVYLNNLITFEQTIATTDGNGNFSVLVPSAEYMVTVTCDGYSNASEYVSLNSNVSLYFALTPG